MGAFTGMAMMGFFPVAGQDVYLIIPPFFREIRIKTSGGNGAIIRKVGELAHDAEAIYIKSAKLNSRPYSFSWLTHRFFLDGGLLELEVSREEGTWGTHEADLPPSYPSGASKQLPTGQQADVELKVPVSDIKSSP
jgi:putative alpha-1,2-mannosidase